MGASGRPSLADLAAPPNLVSLARLALVPVALALLARGLRLEAAGLLVVMFATDGLDGYLARRMGRVTELGKILDPAADKVAVGAVLIYLTAVREFPAWALALVIARDVAIAVCGAIVARRTAGVPEALPIGKVALVALAATTVTFAADFAALEPVVLAVAVVFVVASGVGYAAAMRAVLATRPSRGVEGEK